MTKSDDKRVPVLRFKGFTDEWEQRKLGDIAKTYSGGTPSVTNKNFYNNGYIPFIKSGEIGSSKTEQKINNDGLNNSSAKLVKTGTLLYALYGATSGKAAISPINGAINQAVLAIIPQTNVNRFIYEWLNKNKPRITEKYLQGGQGNLSAKIIKQINIFTTSKNEELKISDILGIVEKIISLQQRKLKLLKLMKNIVSYNLVVSHKLASNDEIKWKAVYLKDIARIYQPTTITKKDLLPKGIPVFGANDYIGFYNKYNHETDQVTICARGASAGHPNYVKGPVWITGNSMVINVDETYINKKFLYTLLTFTDLKRFVTGGAQPQITRENLNSLKILLPSIKAQNNLSAIIENLSINIRKVQLSINSAKRLKQFLLQNMFI